MTGPEKSAEPEVKTLSGLLSQLANRIFKREALLALLTLLAGALLALGTKSWAQGAFDAGTAKAVAPVEARTTKVEQRLDKVEQTQQDFALEQVRSVTMLENLSRDRGLPVPPRVLDAGP